MRAHVQLFSGKNEKVHAAEKNTSSFIIAIVMQRAQNVLHYLAINWTKTLCSKTDSQVLMFPGTSALIQSPTPRNEADHKVVISKLIESRVLGFDIEYYENAFEKNIPAMVQLANRNSAVIWRLACDESLQSFRACQFPPLLHSILTSKSILKVIQCNLGLSLSIRKIKAYYRVSNVESK